MILTLTKHDRLAAARQANTWGSHGGGGRRRLVGRAVR